MAFVRSDNDTGNAPQASINITPLVDVMLVLLVIFTVAVPLVSKVLPVGLSGTPPVGPEVDPVTLHLRASGGAALGEREIDEAQLGAELHWYAAREVQPSLLLRIDPDVRHERLTRSLAAARDSGLTRVAFDPATR